MKKHKFLFILIFIIVLNASCSQQKDDSIPPDAHVEESTTNDTSEIQQSLEDNSAIIKDENENEEISLKEKPQSAHIPETSAQKDDVSKSQPSKAEESSMSTTGDVSFYLEQTQFDSSLPDVINGTVTNNTNSEIEESWLYVIECYNGVSWDLFTEAYVTLELGFIQPGDSSSYPFYLYTSENTYTAGTYRIRIVGMNDLVAEFTIS